MPKRPIARGNRSRRNLISPPTAVFLVGFMGVGKTTVGRIMSEKLGWQFVDLDEMIERRNRRPVAQIFRDSGEPAFRRLEHAALRTLISHVRSGKPVIAALGGGAMAQARNRSLLRRHKFPVIFLDAPVPTLRRRCLLQARKTGADRPLLGTMEEFLVRYSARAKFYRQASMRISTHARRPSVIAAQLIHDLGLAEFLSN